MYFLLALFTSANTGTDREPTEALIEELGMDNVYWTAAQLGKISNDTFLATVEILGAIPGFSADQLAVLSQKATEVKICSFKEERTLLMEK